MREGVGDNCAVSFPKCLDIVPSIVLDRERYMLWARTEGKVGTKRKKKGCISPTGPGTAAVKLFQCMPKLDLSGDGKRLSVRNLLQGHFLSLTLSSPVLAIVGSLH